ncbi:MAG: serine/threonine-protein kinase [Polyangiaceae bacterium]
MWQFDSLWSMLAPPMGDDLQNAAAANGGPEEVQIPPPGSVIAGKYRVEEIIARGGVGVVLSAWHTILNQRVAIKFLLPNVSGKKDAAARFLREARAASRIQSEHVVRILDMGTHDSGAPFLVMEFLVGTDLSVLIRRRGRSRISDAVDYIIQTCEALAEAHALGIVHRDLKPANLFLTERPDGSPFIKVVDFGMSKALLPEVMGGASIEVSLTATSVSVGSPAYMSPEQVRSAKYVDSRTDVWSLGVILFELLAGRPPFEANNLFGICAKITADKPPMLRTLRSDVSEELEAIVMGCLTKDVNERIQNVAELSQALLPFATVESKTAVERIARVLSGTKTRSSRPVESGNEPPVHIPSAPRQVAISVDASSALEDTTSAELPSSSKQRVRNNSVPPASPSGRAGNSLSPPPAHNSSPPQQQGVSLLTLGLAVVAAVAVAIAVMLAIR